MDTSKETLRELQKAETYRLALDSVARLKDQNSLSAGVMPLPPEFPLQDLERYMDNPRRQTGTMTTFDMGAFGKYCAQHADPQLSACFVDAEAATAAMIFNFGKMDEPGHCDFIAILKMQQTAEFTALYNAVLSASSQKDVAEFMEDWAPMLMALDASGNTMNLASSILAIRNIDIKGVRNVGSTVENFSASKSTFEKISAESQHVLPSELTFICAPYHGLTTKEFRIRLSVGTSGDNIRMKLTIRAFEAMKQKIADEFADLVVRMLDNKHQVFIGKFKR